MNEENERETEWKKNWEKETHKTDDHSERERERHAQKIYVTIVKPAIYGPSAMVISE